MRTARSNGFTLMEMSIIMLIIALLTGSILLGKELIYASEIRATMKQVDMLDIAYNTFQLKYNCLAGDCSNAAALGFTGGFTIQLADAAIEPKIDPLYYLNPVSTAFAEAIENIVWMPLDLVVDPSLAWNDPAPDGTVALNGNDDQKFQNMEGSVGMGMLDQAKMIRGWEEGSRIYLSLSEAGSLVGNAPDDVYQRAFWVAYSLVPEMDANGNPSVIDTPGIYYQAPASLALPVSAATIPVVAAANIDRKGDDGSPLTGGIQATSSKELSLSGGPIYNEAREISVTQCLRQINGVMHYNETHHNAAKCAMVIRASSL